MNFREAMDQLGLPIPEIAEVFGLSPQTIRQMRLDEDKDGYRTPPENWRAVLAAVARKRGKDMNRIADQVERGG